MDHIIDGAIMVHNADGTYGHVTVRDCLDCGCLVPGGPTRCKRCAKEVHTAFDEETCAVCKGDGGYMPTFAKGWEVYGPAGQRRTCLSCNGTGKRIPG